MPETLFHIARTDSAVELFDSKDVINWNESDLNTSTKDLFDFFPSLDGRGCINALSKVPAQQNITVPASWLLDTFVKTNRRYMELVFEQHRKEHFPHLPSRYNCIFLCRKQDLKEWYNAVSPDGAAPIYELEPDGNMHFADHRWLDTDIMKQEMYEASAKSYWEGKTFDKKNKVIKEILFVGNLKIINKYSSPNDLKKVSLHKAKSPTQKK